MGVPWKEMSQSDFISYVAKTNILPESMLLSASLQIMEESLKNPDRLTKSTFLLETDPNHFKTELTKSMENCNKAKTPISSEKSMQDTQGASRAQVREKADIKAKLEEARQRRLLMENSRLSKNLDESHPTHTHTHT